MLLVTRRACAFEARFLGGVFIYDSRTGRSETATRRLGQALDAGGGFGTLSQAPPEIASLRLAGAPDETCWLAGDGWWLSKAPPA